MAICGDRPQRRIGPTQERSRGTARRRQASRSHILAWGTVLGGLVIVGAAIDRTGYRCGMGHGCVRTGRPRLGCGLARQAADHPKQQDNEEE